MPKECTIVLASLLRVLTWDAHCHRVDRIARKKHLVRIAHLARCHTLHGDITPEMCSHDGIALNIERLCIPAGMPGWGLLGVSTIASSTVAIFLDHRSPTSA
jgi:hypothetical protein